MARRPRDSYSGLIDHHPHPGEDRMHTRLDNAGYALCVFSMLALVALGALQAAV